MQSSRDSVEDDGDDEALELHAPGMRDGDKRFHVPFGCMNFQDMNKLSIERQARILGRCLESSLFIDRLRVTERMIRFGLIMILIAEVCVVVLSLFGYLSLEIAPLSLPFACLAGLGVHVVVAWGFRSWNAPMIRRFITEESGQADW